MSKSKSKKEILIQMGYDIDGFKRSSAALTSEIKVNDATAKTLQNTLSKIGYDEAKFKQAQQAAQQALVATEKKAQLLREQIKKIEDSGRTDEVREEYERLQLQLQYTENNVEKMRQSLDAVNKIKLDHLTNQLKNAGNNLTNIGQKLSLFSAGSVALGVKLFNDAADSAETESKAEVVFGDALYEINKLAEDSIKNIGIAKQTVYEWTSLYGDMGTSLGQTKQEAAEMSAELTERLADLISFKNINADAAQTIGKALYSGESEPLKNIGVVMTEATLNAYTLAEGYKTLYKDQDALAKLQTRVAYFMHSTSNAAGDFQRTADSASNSVKVVNETLKELSAEFGEQLIPAITPVIQSLTQLLQKFGELDEGQKQNVLQGLAFVAVLGPTATLVGKLTSLIGPLIVKLIAKTKATEADTAAQVANNAATTAASSGISTWITVIGLAISAVTAYCTSAALFADSTKSVTEETTDLMRSIEESKKSYESTVASISADVKMTERLTSRLEELMGATHRSTREQNELLEIIGRINEALPDLNLQYDEQTNTLNNSTSAIRKQIQARKDLLMYQAAEERLVEINKQILDAKLQLEELEEEKAKGTKLSFWESIGRLLWNNNNKDPYNSVVEIHPDGSVGREIDDVNKKIKELYGEYDKLVDMANSLSDIAKKTSKDAQAAIGGVGDSVLDTSDEAKQTALADFKTYTDAMLAEAKRESNEKIALIDKEIKARKKLQEEMKSQKQLELAEQKLKYERDDQNRRELEKEIARLKADIAEQQVEQAAEVQKQAIEDAYKAAENAAQALVDRYAKQIGANGYSYNNTVENYTTSNSAQIINYLSGITPETIEQIVKNQLKAAGVI